jgi:nanoRNase/pAp phosphatase (c-di-AMP/oligoRNAs hydrolase)
MRVDGGCYNQGACRCTRPRGRRPGAAGSVCLLDATDETMGTRRWPSERDAKRVRALLKVLEGGHEFLIVLQDSPDPDAIASAAALRYLIARKVGLPAVVAYGGIIGRAENRALLREVGFDMQHVRNIEFGDFDFVAMVDTQPGVGNNALPPGTPVQVVIDHHPRAPGTRRARFADVRARLGATTTILYAYLKALRLEVPHSLAVALLYGIRSDTMELGRHATYADTTALLDLYPRVDKRVLASISMPDLPPVYFQLLAAALNRTEVAGGVVVSSLGNLNFPDMIAEVADLLLRIEGVEWVMCYGFYERRLLASIRTKDPEGDADAVVRHVVEGLGSGGGHRVMAGAQVPVTADTVAERERLASELVGRFRAVLGVSDRTVRPLLELASTTAVATTTTEQ